MTNKEFAAIRRKTGLSQSQAAALIGMTQQSLSRLETGSRRITNVHAAAIRLLLILARHNLLPDVAKCC